MSMDPFRCQRAIQTAHVYLETLSFKKTAAILYSSVSTVRRDLLHVLPAVDPALFARVEKQLKANRKRVGLSKPSCDHTATARRAIEAASLYLTACSTLRETAERMGLSISTVYSDLRLILPNVDPAMYARVDQKMRHNKAEASSRGGQGQFKYLAKTKNYTPAFRQHAVSLARKVGVVAAAKALGIPRRTISDWCKATQST